MHHLEHLISFTDYRWVLQAKICSARSRKVFHGSLREIDYGTWPNLQMPPSAHVAALSL
jgi:hypothetical protein